MTILHWLPRLFLWLACACLPAVCLSQADDPHAAHTLSGQVVDSVTGQPIARALVRAGGHDSLTDREGRFSLDNPQGVSPAVTKPGYFSDDREATAVHDSVVLKLVPESILYGTVTDTNLQPIQRLEIQLRRQQVRAGLAHWQQMQATTTNAEGEFRFVELAAGKYSLTTGFMVDGLPEASSSLAFVPMAYPPKGSEETGEAITLPAGGHVEANLNLAGEKLYPVSGVIHGSLSRGVSFSLETLEGLPVNVAPHLFPDSGLFRFRVPRGSYLLKLQAQGGTQGDNQENQQFAGRREIAVGPAGLEGVSIALGPLPSIPVEVEYQHSPAAQQEAAAPPFLSLSLTDENPASPFAMVPAQPVDAGRGLRVPQPGDPLIFRSVGPAHYVLQAQVQPPWYVASASCDNLDLTRDLLVVSEGSGACSMRVVLRDDSASLRWSVANPGRPVTVMAFPLANLAQDVGGANTSMGSNDDRVTGIIAGLSPGRYLVIAAHRNLELPYRDPEALRKYAPLGKEVTLAPGSESEIELELAPEEP